MRADIEIYYHPEKPVPVVSIKTRVIDQDFLARCTDADKTFINRFWFDEILPKNPQATSLPRGRANLVHADFVNDGFAFEYVEYSQYLATTRTAHQSQRPVSDTLYDAMRIAAVGAALILPDDTVLVHRRPYTATHVAGVFDCSTAGVLPVDAYGVYLERGLQEKIKRELGLNSEDFTIEGVTGVHSAGAPDFSGLITTVLRTPLSHADIKQRMKPGVFPEVRYIPRTELADFVLDRYLLDDMNHDGAMTLLSSLPYGEYMHATNHLIEAGKNIWFGKLFDSEFTDQRSYM